MATETTKEETKGKNKILVATINIKRGMGATISLSIKSKIIEDFIKSVYNAGTMAITTGAWGIGERMYKLPAGAQHLMLTATRYTPTLDGAGHHGMIVGGDMINMGFLRVAGISEGKTFKFPGLYKDSEIETIGQTINEVIKNMFKEYATPIEYEIEITSEK